SRWASEEKAPARGGAPAPSNPRFFSARVQAQVLPLAVDPAGGGELAIGRDGGGDHDVVVFGVDADLLAGRDVPHMDMVIGRITARSGQQAFAIRTEHQACRV